MKIFINNKYKSIPSIDNGSFINKKKIIIILNIFIFIYLSNQTILFNNNIIVSKNLILLQNYSQLIKADFYFGKIKYLQISKIKYDFSFKYKIIKIEYKIGFYDNNKNLISPSDITLYNKLHIICHFEEINNNNNIIDSIPNIYKNQYFKCIEVLY